MLEEKQGARDQRDRCDRSDSPYLLEEVLVLGDDHEQRALEEKGNLVQEHSLLKSKPLDCTLSNEWIVFACKLDDLN